VCVCVCVCARARACVRARVCACVGGVLFCFVLVIFPLNTLNAGNDQGLVCTVCVLMAETEQDCWLK
jgi:hypothetical protein